MWWKGRRMEKYTKDSKPLIKVGKIPIIQHKINYYKSQGYKNLTLCLGYKADVLKNLLKIKIKILYFQNPVKIQEY